MFASLDKAPPSMAGFFFTQPASLYSIGIPNTLGYPFFIWGNRHDYRH